MATSTMQIIHKSARLSLVLALVGGLAACSSRASSSDDQGAVRLDAGTPDTLEASGFTFVADDDKSEPAVAVKQVSAQGRTVKLAIVARGIAKLQGVAFRLQLTKELKLLSSEGGGDFAAPQGVISLKRVEDELWGGVGRRGRLNGIDAKSVERTVATVELEVEGNGPITLSFRPHHNLVLDSETGQRIDAKWFGGTLQPTSK